MEFFENTWVVVAAIATVIAAITAFVGNVLDIPLRLRELRNKGAFTCKRCKLTSNNKR